jgi:energy-coupling factor transport system ATP-binding protein
LVNLLAKLKQHWTLLVVTHDAGDMLAIADSCWTLNHGELKSVDPTSLAAKIKEPQPI